MLPSGLDTSAPPANRPPRKSSRREFSRRKFLVRAANAAVGSSLLYSYWGEPQRVTVERVTVPLANLPPALDGFNIAQLSDLHCGPVVSAAHIRHGVDLALSLRPDLIALTGDFVTRSAHYITSCAAELRRLRAPRGVFAVLGNHDVWTERSGFIIDNLRAIGITTLINSHCAFKVGSAWLCVLGVDDVWSGRPNLRAAFKGAPAQARGHLQEASQRAPEDAVRLLLAHEPDFVEEAAHHHIALQLSGHSHGGQVRLPGIGALVLPAFAVKYPMGLQQVPGSSTQVYTNRGLGLVNPPVRFNCPPEVTLLTLRRASD